ncbi:MAG: hypothetical protein HQL44_17225 [Alphaproteobacteria bacterium]|nr:hypothetical protein [Alphaproteobacteria bacterium]
MTTLATDTRRPMELGDVNSLPVIASDIIYEGAAVGDNGSGYARPLVAGDPFRGFAESRADNASGSAGDVRVRVMDKGKIELSISGLAITDVGRPVFASDDATFTLVAATNTYIGKVIRYVSSGVGVVAFDASEGPRFTHMDVPVTLANVADGDLITTVTPGFHGWVEKMEFIVTSPVTTGSKASTLNLEVGTTNATGGTLALTSANCTPLGKVVAQAADFTAGNSFTASDTLSIEAASTTTFVEGAGVLRLTLGY